LPDFLFLLCCTQAFVPCLGVPDLTPILAGLWVMPIDARRTVSEGLSVV
jgi:hypothetical protein